MTYFYNFPLNLNIPKVTFKSSYGTSNITSPVLNPWQDKFVTNPIYENFGTLDEIQACAEKNPRIKELLSEYNLPVKINEKELQNLQNGHLTETRVTAAKMYSALSADLKNQVNLVNLQNAAMLHDYGKILIPDKILNKQGELTENEREIIELHPELSYELLKNKGINQETLDLIKYHHQNPQGNGYPAIDNNFQYGLSAQIITTADKYSALTEERSYKPALPKDKALEIMHKDVEQNLISQEVYDALAQSV
ncbi:MAG: HD domain-containing protein [bacterium]|nr:HD domain-containing protein [bacterium]